MKLDANNRTKQSLILLVCGIAINIALAFIKMYVGLSSNSLTIMLDATNSMLDVITGIVTVVAFLIALRPLSDNTPFGYGRAEYLAGFVVAIVTIVVGALFFVRSLNRMAMPEPIWFGWQNCVLISVAVPLKLAIALSYYFFNKKLKSKAIKAIVLDSFLDTAITTTSLISFAISSQINYAVDAIVGIVLSIVIIIFALKMVWDNIKVIVVGDDFASIKKDIQEICQKLNIDVVKIILHDYGAYQINGIVEINFDGDIDEYKSLTTTAKDEIANKLNVDISFSLANCDDNGEIMH